jgi:hypothetical protein
MFIVVSLATLAALFGVDLKGWQSWFFHNKIADTKFIISVPIWKFCGAGVVFTLFAIFLSSDSYSINALKAFNKFYPFFYDNLIFSLLSIGLWMFMASMRRSVSFLRHPSCRLKVKFQRKSLSKFEVHIEERCLVALCYQKWKGIKIDKQPRLSSALLSQLTTARFDELRTTGCQELVIASLWFDSEHRMRAMHAELSKIAVPLKITQNNNYKIGSRERIFLAFMRFLFELPFVGEILKKWPRNRMWASFTDKIKKNGNVDMCGFTISIQKTV